MTGTARPGRREEAGVPPMLRGAVSRVLRFGLVVSVLFAAVGVLGFVAEGIGLGPSSTTASLRGGIGPALWSGNPSAYALLAVGVLVATPLARVAVSSTLFAATGDRTFFLLTLGVLLLLFATVVVGVLR